MNTNSVKASIVQLLAYLATLVMSPALRKDYFRRSLFVFLLTRCLIAQLFVVAVQPRCLLSPFPPFILPAQRYVFCQFALVVYFVLCIVLSSVDRSYY